MGTTGRRQGGGRKPGDMAAFAALAAALFLTESRRAAPEEAPMDHGQDGRATSRPAVPEEARPSAPEELRPVPTGEPTSKDPAPLAPTAKDPAALPQPPEDPDREIKEQVCASLAPEDTKGYQRLGAPKPGEWLWRNREQPQSLERFRLVDARVRPTVERRTIVLQPLGAFTPEQRKVLETLRQYTAVFFQLPVRLAEPLELKPTGADAELVRQVSLGHRHGTYERQYDANVILQRILQPRVPADAAVYMGITLEDLWSDDLHYVFGAGDLKQGVGVYSLCRFYPEFWGNARTPGDEVQGLRRCCKVLNHEIGHIFGLWHCVFFQCTLNGANSLNELDRAPIHLCPVCHRKLAWSLAWDPAARYEGLRAFYAKEGLAGEAAWLTGRLENWRKVAAREAARKAEDE